MNKMSLAHSHVQNQQMPSWNDDPFELKGTFAGVANMNQQRNLDDFIQELVASYGIYCQDHYDIKLDMLTDEEQDELVRLYIESIDREIEWACYGTDESINSDFLCSMLAMLSSNNEKTRENFAIVTRRNLLTYYKDTLNDLLDKGCDVYFHNEMNQSGLHVQLNSQNGDIIWGKF